MTGYLRISGALCFGVIIVLVAFIASQDTQAESVTQDEGAVVSVAPPRSHIAEVDENGDGVPDWEESFRNAITAAITLPENQVSEAGATYEPPTTYTGKFAQALFTDYAREKSAVDVIDANTLVSNAVSSMQEVAKVKLYPKENIVVIPDSGSAIHEYGNAIADIIVRNSKKHETELVIVEKALKANDPAVLQELAPIREYYETVIEETLLVPTPESLIEVQVGLLTGYTAVLEDIKGMEATFTDPLLALVHVKRHKDDITGLYKGLQLIGSLLGGKGVRYEADEPGAYFTRLTL